MIVLAINLSLFYLIGDPVDLAAVWNKLAIWTIPEENLGEQAVPQEEAIFHKVE